MQDRKEEHHTNYDNFSLEDMVRLNAREKELSEYRKLIQQQEKQLDEYRTRLKHEQLAREREIQRDAEEREKFFVEREKKLHERQREMEEHLKLRQFEADELRARLEHELARREDELQQALQELNLEKERYSEESRKKIELKSKDYVADTLETLNKKETQFHKISKVWSGVGAASLAGGLVFFCIVTIVTFSVIPNPVTWEFITFSVFRGLITLALFAALAKYAFLFSNSYMREALKNADRRHAINFGQFYLESYGAAADWAQIKEAFEHWNITGSNAFSNSEETEVDVTALEKFATVIERIGKALPTLNRS